MKTLQDLIEAASELPVAEVWSNGRGKYWLTIQVPTTGVIHHAHRIDAHKAQELRSIGLRYNVDKGMSDF